MRRSYSETDTAQQGLNWGVFKLFWPYLGEFRRRVYLAIGCLILAKLASVTGPFILKHIVDGLDAGRVDNLAVVFPLALILAYGAARFSTVLFSELRDTVFGRVTERAMRRIGLATFRHLHSLDMDYHLGRRTGGLARDIERGTNGISFLMRFFVFNIAPTLLEIVMVTGLLFYNYGVGFALITLVAVLLYVAYSVFATEWRTRFVRELNRADNTSNTRAVDSLLNFETVKYFTNEEYEAGRYDTSLATWEQARRKNRLSLFALNGGQALIIAGAMTAMMLLAAGQVRSGAMSLGDFVLINAFMLQLFLPLNFLGFVYREIKGSMANIEQMFALLQLQPAIRDSGDAGELAVEQGRIEFDKVGFGYQEDRKILTGVSFVVEAGAKVAVVGASGAGKSTLARLLFRFYDVDSGAIRIDGQDIRQVTQHSLRSAIGVVPQDTVLFNDSIFENIRYGRPEASDEEVEAAIRMAHLSQFIAELPKGRDTEVGERGLKLSGGEKQRVAIARVLLKRPPILIFDEATSALDSESEKSILEALRELSAQHTSFVIAHRLSTIVDADKIVVLDHGQVIEQGNHESLLADDGVYAGLWRMQQRQIQN